MLARGGKVLAPPNGSMGFPSESTLRLPQSSQSLPMAHAEEVVLAPPSSHTPLLEKVPMPVGRWMLSGAVSGVENETWIVCLRMLCVEFEYCAAFE